LVEREVFLVDEDEASDDSDEVVLVEGGDDEADNPFSR